MRPSQKKKFALAAREEGEGPKGIRPAREEGMGRRDQALARRCGMRRAETLHRERLEFVRRHSGGD